MIQRTNNYTEHLSTNIGTMLQYAVSCNYDPSLFWNMFMVSSVSKQIELNNPKYLVGFSAIDLLNIIIKETIPKHPGLIPDEFYIPNEFFWAGWAISQYQKYSNISFFNINKAFPIEKVISLYNPLHEADITKFFDVANNYIKNYKTQTNLKKIRKASGLSQSQLSKLANVSIRSIQMYEQKQNDINKAQIDILTRLSETLGCQITDLLE